MMIDEYDERDLAGVDMEDPFANGIFVPIKHMAEFEENMFHDIGMREIAPNPQLENLNVVGSLICLEEMFLIDFGTSV